MAGAAGHRSTRPIAGDRAVHQPGIDRGQGGVAEFHPFHHPGTETLHQYVGFKNALSERVATDFGPQIEREQLLAPVQRIEIGVATGEGTDGVARGWLDLRDLGALRLQQLGAVAAGQKPGEIENPYALEQHRLLGY